MTVSNYFYTNVFSRGNKIYTIGFANGKRFYDEEDYHPYLFIPGEGDYRSLDGKTLQKKVFPTMREARKFAERYEGVENFQFYGLNAFQYVYLNDEFPGAIDYNPLLIAVNFLDIEVNSKNGMPQVSEASQEVTAITLVRKGKAITFGLKYYKAAQNVTYVMCKDEAHLLQQFLEVWNSDEWRCDVVSGWYIENFDIPYLVNRIRNVLGAPAMVMLSPWRIVNEREIIRGKSQTNSSKDIKDRTDIVYELAGISQLDYIQLYKKFTFTNHESYRLDHIAFVELGERKLDYSEYDSLNELYEKNPALYYDYNIHDSILVEKLDDKLGFINQVFALAYTAKVNYNDAFATSRPWDIIIHNHLLEKKICIPQQASMPNRDLVGAHVEFPQIGLHRNIISYDFTGLYPRMISQHNISPETFLRAGFDMLSIDKIVKGKTLDDVTRVLKEEDWILCANKCIYTKQKRGFLPELVDLFIKKRAIVKKEMITLQKGGKSENANKITQLDNYQQALKILTNGLYGALGMKYFRWFDINLAESVTLTGQLYIKWVMARVNEYLNHLLKTDEFNYVIAGDTDSLYINLDPLVQKMGLTDQEKITEFLDNVASKKIGPFIIKSCEELAGLLNTYDKQLDMKREIIANKGIWRGKKNYILNVQDKEGVRYPKSKLVMKGIEAVRSSTPMICRDKIKECLRIIMQENEPILQKYIKDFYIEFMSLPLSDISFPRTVDGIHEYYDPVTICKKATPIHVRGAIIYNEVLKALKLQEKYPLIKNKEKIKFVYLKKPNPIKSHVIALPDEGFLPKQLKLDQYIDYETQWEKSFLSPIQSITDLIGWSTKKRSTLDAAFI